MLRCSGWKAAVATAATVLMLSAAPLLLTGCGGSGNNALPGEEVDETAPRVTSISPNRYVLNGAGVEVVARGQNLRGSEVGIAFGRADSPVASQGFFATPNEDGTEARVLLPDSEIRRLFLGNAGGSVTVNVRVTVNALSVAGPGEPLQITFVESD